MKKILTVIVLFHALLVADTVELKTGWNLIGIPSTELASMLSNNTNIEKATGGGVGNTNAFTYLKSINYSRGNFILGQAYWVKALNDTTLNYTKTSTPNKIMLTQGWNLIYPFKTLPASDLANYPEVEKATGGGVGNTNAFTFLKSINYSRGETLPNQGYWVKATAQFDMIFQSFDYIAWDVGGANIANNSTFRLNGVLYTMYVYSTQDIDQSNASGAGDFTLFQGTVSSKNIPAISINGDYVNNEVALKIFKGENNTTAEALVLESEPLLANNNVVAFNLTIQNPDDFRPISPTDTNIEMPPVAPVF